MLAPCLQQRPWQSSRLAPEDQVVAALVTHVSVKPRSIGLDEPLARGIRQPVLKSLPTRPATPVNLLPIVHARPLELHVVQLKTQWLNQVKGRFRRGAQPCDVSCVGRDLRLQ